MTAHEIEQWKQSRDIARLIQDPEERSKAMDRVYDMRDDLQMECIQHQSDRIKMTLKNAEDLNEEIKGIKVDIAEMKQDMKPCIESDKDYREWKMKIQGGVIMWKILKYLLAAGGGGLLIRFLQTKPI